MDHDQLMLLKYQSEQTPEFRTLIRNAGADVHLECTVPQRDIRFVSVLCKEAALRSELEKMSLPCDIVTLERPGLTAIEVAGPDAEDFMAACDGVMAGFGVQPICRVGRLVDWADSAPYLGPQYLEGKATEFFNVKGLFVSPPELEHDTDRLRESLAAAAGLPFDLNCVDVTEAVPRAASSYLHNFILADHVGEVSGNMAPAARAKIICSLTSECPVGVGEGLSNCIERVNRILGLDKINIEECIGVQFDCQWIELAICDGPRSALARIQSQIDEQLPGCDYSVLPLTDAKYQAVNFRCSLDTTLDPLAEITVELGHDLVLAYTRYCEDERHLLGVAIVTERDATNVATVLKETLDTQLVNVISTDDCPLRNTVSAFDVVGTSKS